MVDVIDGILAEWLRRQLDEEQRAAEALPPWPWSANAEGDEVLAADGVTVAEGFALSGAQLRATVDHVVRYDPARALAEVDAKRRLLSGHERPVHRCDGGEMTWVDEDCPIKVALALPYAARPGYREEWQPQ